MHVGSLKLFPALCNPVGCGLPGFPVGGFSRQEYWSVLANTGCHMLLEHYISCCPSHQLPQVPGAVISPVTQTAALPPHQALTGASSHPPGQTQVQIWEINPLHRGGHKATIGSQGTVWLRKVTQNLPASCTNCRLNPHDQLSKLCVYGIYKRPLRAPTRENALVLITVDIGGKNTGLGPV